MATGSPLLSGADGGNGKIVSCGDLTVKGRKRRAPWPHQAHVLLSLTLCPHHGQRRPVSSGVFVLPSARAGVSSLRGVKEGFSHEEIGNGIWCRVPDKKGGSPC